MVLIKNEELADARLDQISENDKQQVLGLHLHTFCQLLKEENTLKFENFCEESAENIY
jgi:hypothetical protein